MSRKANILSFDEVKRDTSAYRSSSAARNKATLGAPGDLAPFESPFRQTARRTATRTTSARRSSQSRDTGRRTTPVSSIDSVRRTSSSYRNATASRNSLFGSTRTSGKVASQRPSVSASMPAVAAFRSDESESDESPAEEHTSRLKAFKRSRAKGKAERAFTKQFGGAKQNADAGASGSRAAVYKGEMGTKHRQAARMQNEASGHTKGSLGFSFAGLLSLKSSPKFIAAAAVTACLVLSCIFLYPGAQQYYHAVRENDRLQAEYTALDQRNSALGGDIGSLQTDAGIEARAHEQLGWVKKGEETANVVGLDIATTADTPSAFPANVVSGSIEAPQTWYSPFLDALFGAQ